MSKSTSLVYVEDDPISRDVIDIALTKIMKFENVWIFPDSENLIGRLRGLPKVPDVFLLDIHMKPLTGFDMLTLLREDDTYRNARIIALTASIMNEEVEQLKTRGFDGGIGKPIDPDIFPSLIRRIIQGETVWHVTS